ncbi:MAG: peptidoglycan-binding protein [Planctomycetota bacterium]
MRIPALALALALAGVAQAQTDWVAYYRTRVAQFERENRQLDPQKRYVLLVGDSLMEGWKQGSRVSSHLPRLAGRVLNRGIGSDRVGPPRGVLSRMDASIYDCQPSHVVLLVGVNQIGSSGSGIAGAVRDYERILTQVKARLPQVPVIAVSVPPVRWPYADFKQPIVRFNAELRQLAAQHGASYLDLHSLLVDVNGWCDPRYNGDGLHFNDRGYARFGQALEALVLGTNAPGTTTGGDSWLARGSNGPAVSALQRRLNLFGATPALTEDGDFGQKTEDALRSFQRRYGLADSGREDPATRAALAAPSPLRRGRRGSEVERLQTRLNAHGAGLTVDGAFGAQTERALRAFQRGAGIEASGVLDPPTQAALNGGGVLSRGASGPEVERLQRQLNAKGASLTVDGRFGPRTEAALIAFQTGAGLPGSGRLDAATEAALTPPGGLSGALGQ